MWDYTTGTEEDSNYKKGVFVIITTRQQIIDHVLPALIMSDMWSLDDETTGLNRRKDKVIGFGISDGLNSFYLVHLSWNGTELEEVLSKEDCIFALQQLKKKKLVFWNFAFDISFIANYFGVELIDSLYSDGMLALHTIQEEGVPFSFKPFSLKTVAPHYFGDEVLSEQADMKASIKANGGGPNEFYKADTTLMAKYCMQDAVLTIRLVQQFHEQIEREGLSDFYFNQEVMPLARYVTYPLETQGIPVDVPALLTNKIEINSDLGDLEIEIQNSIRPRLAAFDKWFLDKDYPPKRTGPFAQAAVDLLVPDSLPRTATGSYSMTEKAISALPESLLKSWLQEKCYLPSDIVRQIQLTCHGPAYTFNLSSKFHLCKLFFEELGCEPLNRTDTGRPQCDEEFLDSVTDQFTWVPQLIQYNKLTKIKGAYIERLLEEQEDGIWYPSYFQHRTVSGRFGSGAQQFPRPIKGDDVVAKYTNRIRNFLIAGPGHKLVGADYESLEPKIFSHICADEKLKNVFLQGHDFYSTVAIFTEGLTQYSADKGASNYLGKVAPEKRQTAKAYALGVPYGLTGYKMQFELGITQQQGDALVQAYLDGFPGLKKWMHESETKAVEQGFIKSEAGRVRHMPRAQKIVAEYGMEIMDSLALWKRYHSEPALYERMKKTRRELKNYLNNAKNFQCQSLAASIVNRACIAMNKEFIKRGFKAHLCGQTHDECTVLCRTEEAEDVKIIMREVMENHYKISIPLVAIPKIADRYGDVK